MTALTHQLHRTLTIRATLDVVFDFFTDTERWARWWGAGSRVDARVGGAVLIRHPDGTEVLGTVLEISAPNTSVFTYGYASGKPVAPDESRVTIQLAPVAGGTQLSLTHEFADAAARDQHVQGWRYQLSLFANVVSDAVNHNAAQLIDTWFDTWANPDSAERQAHMTRIAAPSLEFHDRFGCTASVDDLLPHIAAAQFYMPGMRMRRMGNVRHCQGTVLADWTAAGPDGVDRARGTNVFVLDVHGRITSVTGFSA